MVPSPRGSLAGAATSPYAAYPDQAIAHELSRLAEPLVIAFDRDDAGGAAAQRLTALLDAHQRHPQARGVGEDALDELLAQDLPG